MYTYMILYMIIYIYAVYITCYTYTRSEFSKKGVLYVSHDVVDDVHNVLHACFPHNLQVSKFSIYTIYSSFAICGWIDTLNDMVTVEEWYQLSSKALCMGHRMVEWRSQGKLPVQVVDSFDSTAAWLIFPWATDAWTLFHVALPHTQLCIPVSHKCMHDHTWYIACIFGHTNMICVAVCLCTHDILYVYYDVLWIVSTKWYIMCTYLGKLKRTSLRRHLNTCQ